MRKLNFVWLLALFASFSCTDKSATEPAYVTINGFDITTNYTKEGTASSKVTTAWVEANGEDLGVFELPVRFPVITNGKTQFTVIPAINLNGIKAYRTKYKYYKPFVKSVDVLPGQEITLATSGKTKPVTGYLESNVQIIKVEDFEGAGVNLEPTAKSDTNIIVTEEATEIFPTTGLDEQNIKSAKIVLPARNSIAEFVTINDFILPKFSTDVYLEVNYKCDVNVTFGIYALENGVKTQAPVVTVFPTNGEWNKIYINLVTEVSGAVGAESYQLFFGAINTDVTETKSIFIDNIKLVY